jgi:hypothetical protein
MKPLRILSLAILAGMAAFAPAHAGWFPSPGNKYHVQYVGANSVYATLTAYTTGANAFVFLTTPSPINTDYYDFNSVQLGDRIPPRPI